MSFIQIHPDHFISIDKIISIDITNENKVNSCLTITLSGGIKRYVYYYLDNGKTNNYYITTYAWVK